MNTNRALLFSNDDQALRIDLSVSTEKSVNSTEEVKQIQNEVK